MGKEAKVSLIDDATQCLAGNLPEGTRLIVFGSQARGDAREDSDVDLLVIEPEVSSRFTEMARLSTLLGQKLIPADVVVISAAAFERQKIIVNTLAWRAEQEGIMHEFAA
jgi:predicted nucleotidyltransferase